MTTPVDVMDLHWVPVPLRWRHVIAGDVFVGADQRLWIVADAANQAGHYAVEVRTGLDTYTDEVDPDDVINVLVPATERDAVELTMDELGARLVERRTES